MADDRRDQQQPDDGRDGGRYWSETEPTRRLEPEPDRPGSSAAGWGTPGGGDQAEGGAWPGWGQSAGPTQQVPPASGWATPGSGGQADPGTAAWGAQSSQGQGEPDAWSTQGAQGGAGTAWAPPGQGAWPPPPQDQGQGTWPPGQDQPGGAGAWPPPPGYGAPPGPQRRSRGWLFALIPLALVVLGIVGYLNRADRDESGAIAEGGTVGVLDLAVGDCLQDPLEGEEEGRISEVQAVPCTELHDEEVYALFDVPEAGEYPGDTDIDQQAQDGCLERFEDYVGAEYEESALYISTIAPRAETWAQGDREVVCLAYLPEEQLTGSVRGTGQ